MATSVVGSGRALLRPRQLAFARGPCSGCVAHARNQVARQLRQPNSNAARNFSSGGSGKQRPRFSQRLGEAMRNTKIQWYQIPVGLGIGFLGLVQFYKVSAREREKNEQDEFSSDGASAPKKRPRIRPDGPWFVVPAVQFIPFLD
jgi:hypothetical protein